MGRDYNFKEIEAKWQKAWEENRTFQVKETSGKKEFYCLEMLPYPSGMIHMGHVRNYSIGDAMAMFRRMQGYNVLHPMGWDSLGMPAENAAIRHKTHPKSWTMQNIEYMRKQIKRLGFGYDWEREITTCLPEYYKWNQWFFLKMMEKGLAYRGRRAVNWCGSCQTVLANEQVEGGSCWRCEYPVAKKEVDQWFLKITEYAQELLDDLDQLTGWPERVRTMQKNWIGRSEGSKVSFVIEGSTEKIDIYTTRIDTIYGATFLVMAPEHPDLKTLIQNTPQKTAVESFIEQQLQRNLVDRFSETTEKVGVFTGRYAINPYNDQRVPIWVANFVLMEYGTGAIMAVPAHDQRDFEFAKKYNIPIVEVIQENANNSSETELEQAFEEDGFLVQSGPFIGLKSAEARLKMTEFAKESGFGDFEVSYRIKDWGISRQRYWGTPIPVIYCEDCGIIPVPEGDLPVRLPDQVTMESSGGSPLERVEEFVRACCPQCGKEGRRETDTMDTFFDSSWYFYRYCDPKNEKVPFSKEIVDYWFPIDLYIGGIEHAIMHLIYCRFFSMFLRDIGLIKQGEPVKKLFTQGMVVRHGAKMSKSKGNVVDPNDMIDQYGADTTRLFSLFASPPEKDLDWSDKGVEGCFRFLARIWRFLAKFEEQLKGFQPDFSGKELKGEALQLRRKTHQTIKKVTEDVDRRMNLNTAIAAIMELVNEMYRFFEKEIIEELERHCLKEALDHISLLLAPFAPHFAEEMWNILGHRGLVMEQSWPQADPELLEKEDVLIVIQVNGKLRAKITVHKSMTSEEVFKTALQEKKLQAFLKDRKVIKHVYVPERLINLVVEE
jgi:leucyl-tRNA synthetase